LQLESNASYHPNKAEHTNHVINPDFSAGSDAVLAAFEQCRVLPPPDGAARGPGHRHDPVAGPGQSRIVRVWVRIAAQHGKPGLWPGVRIPPAR
jgi:hypothetical protein